MSNLRLLIFGMADNKNRRAVCAAVADILRQERISRKMSLATVAEKAGISYQMVGFVERQERNPTLDTVLRICEAIGIDAVDVLKRATQAIKK